MSVSTIGVLPVAVRALHTGQEVAITGRIDVHSVPDVRLLLHEIIDTGLRRRLRAPRWPPRSVTPRGSASSSRPTTGPVVPGAGWPSST